MIPRWLRDTVESEWIKALEVVSILLTTVSVVLGAGLFISERKDRTQERALRQITLINSAWESVEDSRERAMARAKNSDVSLFLPQPDWGQRSALSILIDYGVSLTNRDLSYIILNDTDLNHAQVDGTNFQHSIIKFSNFAGSHLDEADFGNADLESTNFEDSSIYLSNFRMSRLQNANLSKSDVRFADFSESDARCSNFFAGRADGADFRGADLRFADFRWVRVRSTAAQGARDIKRVLSREGIHDDLIFPDFREADLSNANFAGAEIEGAMLDGADLGNANIEGAHLKNLDLRNVRNLSQLQLSSACQAGTLYLPLTMTPPPSCGGLKGLLDSLWIFVFRNTIADGWYSSMKAIDQCFQYRDRLTRRTKS